MHLVLMGLTSVFIAVCALLTYYVPFLIVSLLPEQDLKRKYNAEWALVTGGSSGVGKAITWRLAKQGINVVIAALPDKMLEDTKKEFEAEFSRVKVVAVPVNMGTPEGYFDAIVSATKDLPISLVFNNAGYITTGFFACRAICVVVRKDSIAFWVSPEKKSEMLSSNETKL